MRSQPVCERVLTKKCNQADFRQEKNEFLRYDYHNLVDPNC